MKLEKIKEITKSINDDNEIMRKNTRELREKVEKMNNKAPLCFGVKTLSKMINEIELNTEIVTEYPMKNYLDAEDYKELVLSQIAVIQAYEDMQATMTKTCNRLIENIERRNKENEKRVERETLSDEEHFKAIVDDFIEFMEDIMGENYGND